MFRLRDKMSVTIVFLSCVVAFVMIFFAKTDMITRGLEEADKKAYSSNYSEAYLLWANSGMDVSSGYGKEYSDDTDAPLEILEELRRRDYGDVRISFPGYSLYVNDRGLTYLSGRYILYDNYEKRLPLISGNYYSELYNIKEPVCIVGRGYESVLYKQGNAEYIDIYGRPYRVIGIVGAERSQIYDNNIILYEYNTYQEERECIIEKQRCILMIEGENASNVSNAVNQINKALKGTGYTLIDYNDQQIDMESSYIDSEYYVKGRFLLLGLSLLMIIVVMVYWMKRKMYEFSVRKAFGESVLNIAISMFVDYSIIYLIAGVVAFTIYVILCHFLGYYLLAFKEYLRGIIEVYIKYYAIIVLIEMTVPIVKLVNFTPLNLLRDSDEI